MDPCPLTSLIDPSGRGASSRSSLPNSGAQRLSFNAHERWHVAKVRGWGEYRGKNFASARTSISDTWNGTCLFENWTRALGVEKQYAPCPVSQRRDTGAFRRYRAVESRVVCASQLHSNFMFQRKKVTPGRALLRTWRQSHATWSCRHNLDGRGYGIGRPGCRNTRLTCSPASKVSAQRNSVV